MLEFMGECMFGEEFYYDVGLIIGSEIVIVEVYEVGVFELGY